LSYALVKVGAFTIVSQLGEADEKHNTLDDYAGLGQRQPWVAASLSLFLSLCSVCLSPLASSEVLHLHRGGSFNLIWLAILMAVNSVIGSYYYLRLIIVMYMHEPKPEAAIAPVRFPLTARIVLCVTVAGTLYSASLPPAPSIPHQPKLIGSIK